jgi:hypothetical protein
VYHLIAAFDLLAELDPLLLPLGGGGGNHGGRNDGGGRDWRVDAADRPRHDSHLHGVAAGMNIWFWSKEKKEDL